jgi:heat-inducible transcriptional repressor
LTFISSLVRIKNRKERYGMTTLAPQIKKSAKTDRERQVLLGLVEHYIQTGKPVGSNTLKEVGFDNLSSATIRNYFAHLEEEGYLIQQHTSGGRIPTSKAFKLYASQYISSSFNHLKTQTFLDKEDTRAVSSFLQEAAEELASLSNTAVFLSAPRF